MLQILIIIAAIFTIFKLIRKKKCINDILLVCFATIMLSALCFLYSVIFAYKQVDITYYEHKIYDLKTEKINDGSLFLGCGYVSSKDIFSYYVKDERDNFHKNYLKSYYTEVVTDANDIDRKSTRLNSSH